MVTSHDVAREAGVSQSTVSRVLNGRQLVSDEARTRVLEALDRLGYVPNASAKSMRTLKAGAIGIVASDLANPYFPRLLDALTKEARTRDLNVIVWNDDDPRAPMAQAGVASRSVDGIIFAAARENTVGVELLADRGFPVVLVNRAWPGSRVDQVTSDHEASGYSAADYFLRRDRVRLAAIFGPRDTFASPARERGFRKRVDEAGVIVPGDRWIVGETTYEHGRDATRRLIDAQQLPEAIFCSADVIAFGAIGALREAGLRVPEDVWVMGNDGLPMSEWQPFDLTTHRQPVESIARSGMDALVSRLSGSTVPPQRIIIPTELIVRGSTDHA
jgi:LacI family transcriptional regulator